MTEVPAIEMKHVWFSYDRIPVLEDVSFVLDQGDFLGIIGPNGGGKSTLIRILLGLLKPDRGVVKVLGETPHDARHRVGYVPQTTDFNISFPISAWDIAMMGRLSRSRVGRRYSHNDRLKVEDVLKKVGMWDQRTVQIGKLSGGQRQRIFIARALSTDPEVLFLDEPTASIDPEFETDLFDLLKTLGRGVTIVIITHDVGAISRNVKSVACVNRSLVFHGDGQITDEMLDMAYHCPVDLIAHGIPHRVLPTHKDK